MPNTGDESLAPGDVHECWSILPAVAAVTSRLRLGPLVAPTSIHHPALLANRAATLDRLSKGRLILGVGAGWQINEHAAYGIPLKTPGMRVSRFEESIQIVRSLLDSDRTTFHGDFYDITDAPSDPKPVQETLPILVGTGSPRMLRITAQSCSGLEHVGCTRACRRSPQRFRRVMLRRRHRPRFDALLRAGTDLHGR